MGRWDFRPGRLSSVGLIFFRRKETVGVDEARIDVGGLALATRSEISAGSLPLMPRSILSGSVLTKFSSWAGPIFTPLGSAAPSPQIEFRWPMERRKTEKFSRVKESSAGSAVGT